MPYRIAGIDVNKKMLAIVVADVESDGEYHFERQRVGTSPGDLRRLADWLVEREVEEVVMESTAQYWRPVWEALEQYWRPVRRTRAGASPVSGTLHLAHAQSNRDEHPAYQKIGFQMRRHDTIKHGDKKYVDYSTIPSTHTNTVEGFFSLLKRG